MHKSSRVVCSSCRLARTPLSRFPTRRDGVRHISSTTKNAATAPTASATHLVPPPEHSALSDVAAKKAMARIPTKNLLRSLALTELMTQGWLLRPSIAFMGLIANSKSAFLNADKNPILIIKRNPTICSAALPIPVDLFLSRKHPDYLTNSSGDIVYRLSRRSLKSSSVDKIVLLDAAASPLISIYRVNSKLKASNSQKLSVFRLIFLRSYDLKVMEGLHWFQKESWQGFKGDIGEEDLLFKVQRTLNKLRRTEFRVFLVSENLDDSNASLEMKGWPFQRSCTIYKGNTIVAQTSLMHKLHQIWVRRGRFRLTIFPGSVDPALIVTLIVIFFDGRI